MTPTLPKDVINSISFFQSQLFHDVQMSKLFPDSKTFADALPNKDYGVIAQQYLNEKGQTEFDLLTFIQQNFALPDNKELLAESQTSDILSHIEQLWDLLSKPADPVNSGTLLSLPRPYIVPGGRFREVYYWDTYFTAVGLVESGRRNTVIDIVENFIHLQQQIGLIPNGNRSYYFSRSQPPVLALLIELIVTTGAVNKAEMKKYLAAMKHEYDFWMQGEQRLSAKTSRVKRLVRLSNGAILNRYWDDLAEPRPESYLEDIELAEQLPAEQRSEFYRNIRAACESGWDFSSRWLAAPSSLLTIRTSQIVPIDLNSLLYKLELSIAKYSPQQQAAEFTKRAAARKQAIEQYLWKEESGFYMDMDIQTEQSTGVLSLASAWPLYLGLASTGTANMVARKLENEFLRPGGLVTTLTTTEQQWDAPNAWAPLQWVAIQGLKQYGHKQLANDISQRWQKCVEAVFQQTGKLMEKYNVEQPKLTAGGGEYEVQEGFGWTNGTLLALSKATS